jgi:hypothetical protein
MNNYLCYITGQDGIGYSFIKNLVELANKGAKLQEGKVPCMRFPYSAFMELQTEDLMEDKPGFKFQVVQENYTRDQLDALEWSDFKAFVKKKHGIGGRDRAVMTNQYLKTAFGGDDPEVKEEDK